MLIAVMRRPEFVAVVASVLMALAMVRLALRRRREARFLGEKMDEVITRLGRIERRMDESKSGRGME